MIANLYRNLKIGFKLLIPVSVLCVVLAVTVALAVKDTYHDMVRFEAFSSEYLVPISELGRCRAQMLKTYITSQRYCEASAEERPGIMAELASVDSDFEASWRKYIAGSATDTERQHAASYREHVDRYIKSRNAALVYAKQGNIQRAKENLARESFPILQRSIEYWKQIMADNVSQADAEAQASRSNFKKHASVGIGFSLVGLIVSIVLVFIVLRTIQHALSSVNKTLDSVASGNLQAVCGLQSRDELGTMGKTLDGMVLRLRSLLSSIRTEADGVASGATQLSASAEQMAVTGAEVARSADNQRIGAERMASGMTELAASIEAVSQGSHASLERVNLAFDATQRGSEAGQATLQAMQAIHDTAQQIAKAVNVIQEIAQQTNLLSLNAAIEAAKAGEHGKGFAVVAEEVRKLAERSSVSAKEVAQQIGEANAAIRNGQTTVSATADLLVEIRNILEEFASVTKEAALATDEQARAGQEVAGQVDASVQESSSIASAITEMSATTAEVASTSSELHRLAESLRSQVETFNL
nr:methyl-accepting chemotaxis protein [uncultured Holophaga sp.]